MNKRWKGLAALIVAGALVIAPLATAGAVADDAVPPDDTAVVAPEPAVTEEAVAPEPEPVATEEPVAEPVAEPEPEPTTPVVAEPEPTTPPAQPQPPAETRTTEPESYGLVLALWQADNGTEPWPQHLVGSVKTVSELLDALDHLALDCGSFYQADLYADDEVTASLLAGGFLNGPSNPAESWPHGQYKSHYSKQWTTAPCPELTPVTPTLDWVPPSCDEPGSLILGPGEGIAWAGVLNDDGSTTYTASATAGFVIPAEAQVTWTVPNLDQLSPTDPQCIQTLPEPALFAADPVPPTCDTDGALPDFEEEFPNVSWFWDREFDGIGTYTLTVVPDAGYAFDPVNITEPWTLNEDGSITREVTVDGALGFQGEDPNLPCYLAPPLETTLGQPSTVDECGTANDFGYLPDDTATVTYEWVNADDPDNWDFYGYVADGYDITGDVTNWERIPDENIWVYTWSPLPSWSDEPCANDPDEPNTPPTKGETPKPPLAATGNGVDYSGWTWGAIAGVIAGLTFVVAGRRAARR
jgi:hypothetical protein